MTPVAESQTSKRLSRRQYIKYAGAGIVAVAVAGLGYYGTRPPPTQTETSSLKLLPPTADFEYEPSYINPTSADIICFLNKSRNPDGTDTDLAYSWYVDDHLASNTKDHFAQLSSGEIATPHEVRLSACRAGLCNDVEKLVRIDPTSIPEYPERMLHIPIKGIVVDAGTKVDDFYDSKRNITDSELEAELVDITNKELGCNGLRIYGSYDFEVLRYAEIAARGNFDAILLCPRYVSQDTDEVVRRTVDFAARAEALRSTSKSVVLQIGQELSTDVSGIFEGRTWLDRVFEVGDKWHKHGWQQKLNQLLNDLAVGVSVVFHGPTSYSAGPWELDIPWNQLDVDIIGCNQYWYEGCTEQDYLDRLRKASRYGKPVYNTEFGSCTYKGSWEYGGAGFAYVEGKEYSQEAQAEYVRRYLDLNERAQMDGLFLFTLSQNQPGSLDKNSMGILKLDVPDYSYPPHYSRKKAFYAYKSYQTAT